MLTETPTLIYEGANSYVYKTALNGLVENTALVGYQEQSAILKVLKNPQPSREQLTLFYNEYEIIKNLEVRGVRRVLRRGRYQDQPALWLEYVPGVTLKEMQLAARANLTRFFDIAIPLAQIMAEVHQAGIIHKDLNSNNVLYNPDNKQVTLIDFGISSKITLKKQHLGNPEKLEGTLDYISPEQTGRMNRVVDYRTDLYSLGIVFFELLTGRLPFQSNDAMELVHAHLAHTPPAPHTLNPDVPEVLSEVVLKLLSKNAEDRYRSAFGLLHDLKIIRERWEALAEKSPDKLRSIGFAIAQEDYSGQFQIPEKLYGRQVELERLLKAYQNACSGRIELLLVEGYSGVGKSALVHEIYREITEKRGYFIEGKFDQFQRNIPYFAWIQAFKSFINQVLTESPEQLENWKSKILGAIGSNGRLLTDVLPSLELVIGEQPELLELGVSESQNRFNYVMQNFVNCISKREHPMVIFIDDWQWADNASLALLKTLLENQAEDYLLIIGSYRSNEVGETHPFRHTIEEIKQLHVSIDTLEINNLPQQDVTALISDSLQSSPEVVAPLAELVYQKTQGNPFFVTQTLRSLYEEHWLYFDFEQRLWRWDLEKLKNLNISDNVVDLIAKKYQKLNIDTKETLKQAACIGSVFSVDFLTMISPLFQEPEQIAQALEPALIEGLIAPHEYEYKFVHDRIQQAIYAQIPTKRKRDIHLRIGRLLLEKIPPEKQEEYIFDIVNQWNYGITLLQNPTDKLLLATLNLQAGNKAKGAAAYRPAFVCFTNAISLLDAQSCWTDYYEFTLKLFTEAAQTAFLLGEFDLMHEFAAAIVQNAARSLDHLASYEIRMQYYIANNRQQEALDHGLEFLEMVGIPLETEAPAIEDIPGLAYLPELDNETVLAAMDVMDSIITPAWAMHPRLFKQICYTMNALSIRHGNCTSSAVGYAFYGGLLCGGLGDIDQGYAYGKAAMELIDRYGNEARYIRSKVENIYISTVMHWKEPARATLQPHFDAVQVGLETGEIEFASYNIVESNHYHFLMGGNLETLAQKYQKNLKLIKKLKQAFHETYLLPWYEMVLNLRQESDNTTLLKSERFDEHIQLPLFEEESQLTLAFVTYQAKTILHYWLDNEESAYPYALKAEQLKAGVVGMMFLPTHSLFYGLTLLAKVRNNADEALKQELLATYDAVEHELAFWESHCPANIAHKLHLLRAERLSLDPTHNLIQVLEHYEQAIDLARHQRFIQEQALANEAAAKYFLRIGREKFARVYMEEARYLYDMWGAKAKVALLDKQYKTLLVGDKKAPAATTNRTTTLSTTTSSSGAGLDMNTIIKASQTLSEEVVLAHLLEKMMRIVIENAGAQKGYLILEGKDQRWYIEAEGNAQQKEVDVMQHTNIDEAPLSNGVINYVTRLREGVILNNASEEGKFVKDPHIQAHKPKSLLCLPLLNKGKLTGILYLENNLVTAAFTQERIEILSLLSSQIAISIENARLYENLEEKVQERTAKLNAAYEEIEKKNHDITGSINYARRIQQAMLPRMERINTALPESFILFMPRDIVSGDFYWFAKQQGKTIIAAVDCTGHGVPGAFMSLIGSDRLHNIVSSQGIVAPARILDELHLGINQALKQDKTENRDGMDLALCVLDPDTHTLQFAGAKNPLIYIQNGELIEVAGDKMPIGGRQWGKNEKERRFGQHEIPLRADTDTYCYLFSDGYPDQFGGEKNMKFMKKHFKSLLLDIHQRPFEEQRIILRDTIRQWMGDEHKQLDDILVIGFKVPFRPAARIGF
ncbi:AAA family ATPase [Eisenibacter elegans]|uniref:AAA family ATPase n=1 Tax=Eisenibacter elegans TaxID=997 RepID=UPI000418162F|nr:AAA family ATPase [Eisenibacter elegans]